MDEFEWLFNQNQRYNIRATDWILMEEIKPVGMEKDECENQDDFQLNLYFSISQIFDGGTKWKICLSNHPLQLEYFCLSPTRKIQTSSFA